MTGSKLWLVHALIIALFWGLWGALIEIPEKAGFPATLGYCVWALTMIPAALFALVVLEGGLDHDRRSVLLGVFTGLLGCAGQLVLFQALRIGPAYLIFPFVALSPVMTLLLSVWFLKERATGRGWTGIVLAIVAIFFLSYQPPGDGSANGYLWIALAFLVALMWALQAYLLRFANRSMKAESLIVYTVVAALALIPVAAAMTDFTREINWGFRGPYLAALIQLLNVVGFVCLVYAFRYGKAIIVSPMVNAAPPVITVIVSLLLYRVIPHPAVITGIAFALAAALLMALEPDQGQTGGTVETSPQSGGST